MIYVANPIYDTVFKYLMEDNRIVKTILSALLKKKVLAADVRKHEYTNGVRDKISMFRIDFGAKVQDTDGTERLVLIELQKTWVETETLRFRQYLGAQYANPDNMLENDPTGHGLPMVAVYLLGHRVGDIEEPILYVHHKSYDYNGKIVTKGLPDPFVESLTHDSIIVQIPLLHGQVNNRLEEILNVFDQRHRDGSNRQMLKIDETEYADDPEMMRILHRLSMAAADAKIRQDMNVEDEYFRAIENRDTAIMMRDKRIEEQDQRIEEQDQRIEEQDQRIEEQDQRIEEQGKQIEEQGQQLLEKDQQLLEKDKQMEEKDQAIQSMVKLLKQSGMDPAQIAAMTRLPLEAVQQMV